MATCVSAFGFGMSGQIKYIHIALPDSLATIHFMHGQSPAPGCAAVMQLRNRNLEASNVILFNLHNVLPVPLPLERICLFLKFRIQSNCFAGLQRDIRSTIAIADRYRSSAGGFDFGISQLTAVPGQANFKSASCLQSSYTATRPC